MQPYKWHQMGQPFSARKLLGVPSEATHLAQDFPVPTSAIKPEHLTKHFLDQPGRYLMYLEYIYCSSRKQGIEVAIHSKSLPWKHTKAENKKKTLPKINGPQNCENSFAGITGSCLSLCNGWIPIFLCWLKPIDCLKLYINVVGQKTLFHGQSSISLSLYLYGQFIIEISTISFVPFTVPGQCCSLLNIKNMDIKSEVRQGGSRAQNDQRPSGST